MKINRKVGLAIGAGVLSVGVFGAAGYAYFETSIAPVPAPATSSAPVATADPSTSAAPMPDRATPAALKRIAKGLTASAATYLGTTPMALATQLKAGRASPTSRPRPSASPATAS